MFPTRNLRFMRRPHSVSHYGVSSFTLWRISFTLWVNPQHVGLRIRLKLAAIFFNDLRPLVPHNAEV